jgi:hypothetical protein
MQQDFINLICPDSLVKVCRVAYTDNPPFSCSKNIYPNWFTIIATAFANASGAWSICFLLIKLFLRFTHPHYIRDFEYDHKKERYNNRNLTKVHTEDGGYVSNVEDGAADHYKQSKEGVEYFGKPQ